MLVGHVSQFLLLGVLALIVFPALRRRPVRYIGLALLVGVGQECFQLLFKHRPLVFDDGFDVLIDLLGALGAYVAVWVWRRASADPTE
ncbi:MAG TPA: hypothetical protein VF897_10655 [Roseiflexaceae bacterium]